MQNVYVMYIEISYKFHRIPDTQSRVLTKVYDFLGQPSYITLCYICYVPGIHLIKSLNFFIIVSIDKPLDAYLDENIMTLNGNHLSILKLQTDCFK